MKELVNEIIQFEKDFSINNNNNISKNSSEIDNIENISSENNIQNENNGNVIITIDNNSSYKPHIPQPKSIQKP